ncbi:uncharacterized protein C10orf120 homolog [Sciurus carolinensis]|uniref:uncharacterized protein C10orf120 homolog n=1 Tax=Sciurus carolinensis TaxID=30640 RepID=UPI001FB3AF27|nr:uncharacterized protein C10orf120 homolog [Sciurus carolinensis]
MGDQLSEDGKTKDWTSGAQEKTVEETSPKRDGKSVRILSVPYSFPEKDSQRCQQDPSPALQLRTWSKSHQLDPRIAFGKYSPVEKEILRLGGIHTMAARRFLAFKKEEESKMLKELQSQSLDHKQVPDPKKQAPTSCTTCAPLEKVWTAKVVVPSEEFKMPRREKITIGKHIERMQLARALSDQQLLPYLERFRGPAFPSGGGLDPLAKDKTRKGGDNHDSYHHESAKQKEQNPSKRHEIKMNIIFKSEEPKKCITCHRHDRQPFLTIRKLERSITGQTNRNRLNLAEFPGDLMLMTQDLLSQGIPAK